MSKDPSSIDQQTLTTTKRRELSALEQGSFITRMDKEVFGDELRRKSSSHEAENREFFTSSLHHH